MMDHLISLIEREMDSIKFNILSGSCPDFLTYRMEIATLHAFGTAIELIKKAFAEDEDE
jgi:hypothetical protein